MTFNAIVWKMIRVNFKRYLLYLSCNTFAILFLFLFFSIYYNDEVERMKETNSFDTVLAIPAAALVLFIIFFIQYAHQMFIKKRTSEFGLFMVIGMSPNNISRLIMLESFVISVISILLGLGFGALFSKLFFLVFSYFSMLNHAFFHISFKMFAHTTVIFMCIFWAAVAFSIVQIRHQTLLTSLQSKRVIDVTRTNKSYFGVIGIVLLILSILGLYITYAKQGELLFLWALPSFFGLYLLLSNGIHSVINVIKGQPSLYFRSILLFSSLEQKQKKLTSLLTLASIMIMITTLYCTITLFIAKHEYDKILVNNPSDIAYIENEHINNISKEELFQLFEQQNNPIVNLQTIPIIEIAKDDYYEWKSYYNILSIDDYNALTNEKLQLDENEFVLFINQEPQYIGDLGTIATFELDQFKLTKKHENIELILTYVGQSTTFIVVHPNVWQQVLEEHSNALYYQLHIHVADWKNSLLAVEQLQQTFKQTNPETSELFAVSSKIQHYTQNKSENAVLFYLLTFISILFYFGVFALLYLNLTADIELELSKFEKLYKIGITKNEIKRKLTTETFILFFTPTLLGIVLAFLYVVSMVQDIGGITNNLDIVVYFLLMSGIYFFIQFCFFLYTKGKLFTKVWRYLSND